MAPSPSDEPAYEYGNDSLGSLDAFSTCRVLTPAPPGGGSRNGVDPAVDCCTYIVQWPYVGFSSPGPFMRTLIMMMSTNGKSFERSKSSLSTFGFADLSDGEQSCTGECSDMAGESPAKLSRFRAPEPTEALRDLPPGWGTTSREDALSSLTKLSEMMTMSGQYKRIETLFIHLIHLSTLRNSAQFITGLATMLHSLYGGAILPQLLALAQEVEEPLLNMQAGEDDNLNDKLRKGYGATLDSTRAVWHTELARRLRRLFAMCIAGGLLGDDIDKKAPGLYRRLIGDVDKSQLNALDIGIELADFVRVTWDTITQCVTEWNFGPLMDQNNIKALDLRFALIKSRSDTFFGGGYESTYHESEKVFIAEVSSLLESVSLKHKKLKGPEVVVTRRYLQELTELNARIVEYVGRPAMRKAPFVVSFNGTTGTGKTSLVGKFSADFCKQFNLPADPRHIAWINTIEKYASTVTNASAVIVLDDMSNTRIQFMSDPDIRYLIAIANGTMTPVEKAALEDKGTVFYKNDLLIVTTNCKYLQAKELSNEQSSILRRIHLHVDVTVAPGYATTGPGLRMVDASRLTRGCQYQRFTVSEWKPDARDRDAPTDKGNFVVVPGGRDLPYDQFMTLVNARASLHRQHQEIFMAEQLGDAAEELCLHGITTESHCSLCSPEIMVQNAGEDTDPIQHVFFGPARPRVDTPVPSPSTAAAESPQPSPPGVRERMRNVWRVLRDNNIAAAEFAQVSTPSEEPPVIGFLSAVSRGRLDMEDLFATRPRWGIFTLFGCVPSFIGLSVAGVFSLFSGMWITLPLGIVCSLITTFTLAHGTLAWISARVAGYTLTQLRKKMTRVALSGASLLGVAALVGVIAVVVTALLRRKPDEPRTQPAPGQIVVNVGARSAVAEPALAVPAVPETPAPPNSPVLAATNIVEAAFEELVENGGCASVAMPRVPSPPDPTKRRNDWEVPTVVTHHVPSKRAATTTGDQAINVLDKHTYVACIEYMSGQVVKTNALMVETNVLLMPLHNYYKAGPDGPVRSSIKQVHIRRSPTPGGPNFEFKVGESNVYPLEGDLALVHCLTGGTHGGVLHLIGEAEALPPSLPLIELARARAPGTEQDYKLQQTRYIGYKAMVENSVLGLRYIGLHYERPGPTYKGLCGAPVLVNGRALIVGMHTMGGDKPENARRGACIALSAGRIRMGLERLRANSIVPVPNIVSQHTEPYAPPGMCKFSVVDDLSPNSALHECGDDTSVVALGTVLAQPTVSHKSSLIVSPYSNMVTDFTGMSREHEPPTTIGKKVVWVKKLAEFQGTTQLDPDIYKLALLDHRDEWDAIMQASPVLQSIVRRPLSLHEAVNGIVGCTSMRRMKMSTSMGYPYTGPKASHTIPAPTPEQPDAIRFKPEIETEFWRVVHMLKSRIRPNLAFKWSPKDEAVKIGKLKTRVFEASPVHLQLAFRMFFGPILRVKRLCPFELRSAVGIDATSKEWNDMVCRAMEYNADESVVGDWIHFDTSQVYQEVMAQFATWIAVLEKYGEYTEEEILAMWTLAEETARRAFIMQADAGQALSGTASGGTATVDVNDDVNGNRLSSGFYSEMSQLSPAARAIQPARRAGVGAYKTLGGIELPRNYRDHLRDKPLLAGLRGRFADYVGLITYGDDFHSAPIPAITPYFNQRRLEAWFAKQGKGLTSPDKVPFTTDTTPWSDVTFLKRGFRYDDETGYYMAPLTMSSIFKPMHVVDKHMDYGLDYHYATLIDGAQREMFQHGRLAYDGMAPKLAALAKNLNITSFLQHGRVMDYEYWLQRYLQVESE